MRDAGATREVACYLAELIAVCAPGRSRGQASARPGAAADRVRDAASARTALAPSRRARPQAGSGANAGRAVAQLH